MNWEKICKLEDILPNAGVCVLVKDKQIAIFRLEEKLYAIDNLDPFSNANVLSRGIVGDLQGKHVVASPIYKQHFSLADGQCLEDETVQVATYETRLSGDIIEISVA